jgi:hypothetical protein
VGHLGALSDFERGGGGDSDVLLLQISGASDTVAVLQIYVLFSIAGVDSRVAFSEAWGHMLDADLPWCVYRGTSLIRNCPPRMTTVGP